MSNTNKYPCLDCDGEGKHEVDSPEGDYITKCRECDGTGKKLVKITREEYDELKTQLQAANEQIKAAMDLIGFVEDDLTVALNLEFDSVQWLEEAANKIARFLNKNIQKPVPADTGKEET